MFVANLLIVKATCACTTIGCLILVSCLSIWCCSSLHSIIKVFRDIRRFSFHYVLGYRPLCTYSLKITLHGLHHIDRLGAVFSCSNMMLWRWAFRLKAQGKNSYLWQVLLPVHMSSEKQNPPFSVSFQTHALPYSSISFMLQAQPSAVTQQNNGEYSKHVNIGHFITRNSCVTISTYDRCAFNVLPIHFCLMRIKCEHAFKSWCVPFR